MGTKRYSLPNYLSFSLVTVSRTLPPSRPNLNLQNEFFVLQTKKLGITELLVVFSILIFGVSRRILINDMLYVSIWYLCNRALLQHFDLLQDFSLQYH